MLDSFHDTQMRIIDLMGDQSTTNIQLEKLGYKLLGEKFIGVFMADNMPNLKDGQCLIMNTDSHEKGGVHWCSLFKYKSNSYFYDSFARDYKKLSSHWKNKGWINILKNEKQREQSFKQSACGALALAFLISFKQYKTKLYEVLNLN